MTKACTAIARFICIACARAAWKERGERDTQTQHHSVWVSRKGAKHLHDKLNQAWNWNVNWSLAFYVIAILAFIRMLMSILIYSTIIRSLWRLVARTSAEQEHAWAISNKLQSSRLQLLLMCFCILFLIPPFLKSESLLFMLTPLSQHLRSKQNWSHRLCKQKSSWTASCHFPDKNEQFNFTLVAAMIHSVIFQILTIGFTSQATTFQEFQRMWNTIARPN